MTETNNDRIQIGSIFVVFGLIWIILSTIFYINGYDYRDCSAGMIMGVGKIVLGAGLFS